MEDQFDSIVAQNEAGTLYDLFIAREQGKNRRGWSFKAFSGAQKDEYKSVELFERNCDTKVYATAITPSGVTVISFMKCPEEVVFDWGENMYEEKGSPEWGCDIHDKMAFQEEVIRDILTNMGLNNVEIRKVVALAGTPVVIGGVGDPDVSICRLEQLPGYIYCDEQHSVISQNQMKQLQSRIFGADFSNVYPAGCAVKRYRLSHPEFIYILGKNLVSKSLDESEFETNDVSTEISDQYRDISGAGPIGRLVSSALSTSALCMLTQGRVKKGFISSR